MYEIEILIIFSAISFVTSFITSVASVGGGMIMLASLAQYFSPSSLIPIHALIQLSNNVSRTYLFRKDIVFSIFKPILIGSIFGSVIGIVLFSVIPEGIILLLIGLFIILMVFFKHSLRIFTNLLPNALCGIFSASIGMLVGANGPIVSAFLAAKNLQPKELIGTHGAIMVAQHLFKIIAFISLFNFALLQYLVLVICTTLTGFLGAWLAKIYLEKISKHLFDIALSILLTSLSVLLIMRGSLLIL